MLFKQIQLLKHIENNPDIPVYFNDKGAIMEGITDINSTLYVTLTLRSLIFRGLVEVIDDCKVRITDKGINCLDVADRVQEIIKDNKYTTKSMLGSVQSEEPDLRHISFTSKGTVRLNTDSKETLMALFDNMRQFE